MIRDFLKNTLNVNKHGKGFKDNDGELIVKVTQSREATVSSNH